MSSVCAVICADLDVSPGDWQDGTGAPGGGANGAQWTAGVDRLHDNHRVARQEGGKVGLPEEEQAKKSIVSSFLSITDKVLH